MAQLATFCKNCCFYNNEDKSCKTGYLDKFKSCDSKIVWEEDGPVIYRVCPSRRTTDWEHKDDPNLSDLLEKEMYISGSILVIANSLDGLSKTLDELSGVENINKFNIIIVHRGAVDGLQKLCEDKITFSNFTCVKSYLDNTDELLFDAFKRVKNGYLITLDSDKDFDPGIIGVLNSAVNHKMKQVLHVIGTDGAHQSATMCLLYKWLKGDLMIDITSKIRELTETQGLESQIFTWKELDE